MNYSLKQLKTFLLKQKAYVLLAFILILLTFGVGYSIHLGDELRFLPDERDYLILAQNITFHQKYAFPVDLSPIWPGSTPDGFVPTAFRAPGYPLLLAAFLWLGIGIVGLRVVNFLTLAASLLLVYQILKEQSKSIAAIIGALFVFAYPVLLFTASTFYPQILGGLLFLGVIYLTSRQETTIWKMALAGLLWGYLVLTIPLFLFTFPIFFFWLVIGKEVSAIHLIAFVGISLLIIGIWTYRNYLVYDTFVLITTNFGLNLALGNSEFTVVNAATDINFLDKWPIMHELTEIEQNAYLKKEAVDFILNNKGQTLKLYLAKFINYFNYQNKLASENHALPWQDILMLLSYGIFLWLAGVRLSLHKIFPFTKFELFLLTLYLGSAFVSAIFFTKIRLRLPFDYALILFDALFMEKTIHYLINTKENRMKIKNSTNYFRRKKILYSIGAIILIVVVILIINPKSCSRTTPSHHSPTTTASSSAGLSRPSLTPSSPSKVLGENHVTPVIQPTISITGTPKPTYPVPKKQITILLLGTDKKQQDTTVIHTDVLMLIVINTKDDTVNILSIPRDLYVEIPGGWGKNRINTAYELGGFSTLADTLSHNFGVRPDYYALVDYMLFPRMIDDLDGIDVQVGKDYCHRQLVERSGEICVSCDEICVSKGEVHMDGYLATWYAQTRYTTSDFDRHRRHQELLEAIFERVLELNTLTKVPKLYSSYKETVSTDLKLRTVLSLVPTAAKLTDRSRINQYFIGPNDVTHMTTATGARVLLPRPEKIQAIVEDVLNQ